MKKIFSKLTKKHLVVVSVVLMVALVVGMGAMTYAKYVSSYDAGTYTATAAKWGFVVTANADNLFGEKYASNGTGNDKFATVTANDNKIVVKGSADATLVAPGTTGYLDITAQGQAEVAAQLNINISLAEDKIIGDGGDYKPLEWALVSGTTDLKDAVWTTDPEALTTTAYYEPGQTSDVTYRLYWRWTFTHGSTEAEIAENNKKDTVIGAKVAATTETTLEDIKEITGLTTLTEAQYNAYVTTLEFTATVAIEQVQEIPTTTP
ncbi:MAG: hypothetical protein IJD73_02100 [Clostridia bacterium]|nr:hypothetical protein [Clostridia bacterium]